MTQRIPLKVLAFAVGSGLLVAGLIIAILFHLIVFNGAAVLTGIVISGIGIILAVAGGIALLIRPIARQGRTASSAPEDQAG